MDENFADFKLFPHFLDECRGSLYGSSTEKIVGDVAVFTQLYPLVRIPGSARTQFLVLRS